MQYHNMEYHNMSIDELARQAEHDENKLALRILDELEAEHKEALEEAVSEALMPLEQGIERAISNLEDLDYDIGTGTYDTVAATIAILEDLLK